MTRVLSPVAGRVVGLAGVPDPVFAQAMVGPGTAVDPERGPGEALAPVTGKLVKLHPHAYVVVDEEGHGVLVHLGIDTVKLKGQGFELLVSEGDQVTSGQPVVAWDPSVIEAGGRSPVCAVVALDAGADALSDVVESGEVTRGAELFTWN
ncbi:PTS system N-acetylglucosamine-specific IIA component (Glc family) [Actinomadura pelletieri DSM 43383]|uniref:PTS system N-acetylglucosamine-specific IIA component (Glc family) n=1 Tax=Actinomadura pelletieri DSM 43383 TaxID=1120940 RepID=A0A495QSF9_9ACTN|nr:PTS glucose transporter subunit IIA [Actinomadura pelletieri]RKS76446.1 PTS system N-acetylglucosamine-specific IIA component (Glc family) [Actinomadura pelletieri DSM 43383]